MDLYMLHMDVLRACWRFQKGSSSDSVGKAKQSKAKQSKAKQLKLANRQVPCPIRKITHLPQSTSESPGKKHKRFSILSLSCLYPLSILSPPERKVK